jgi:hypothetical protein
MSGTVKAPDGLNDRRFVDMNSKEKLAFIGKAMVFFLTGGFVYPTMWVD